MDISQIFEANGLLSKKFDNYEPREGQVRMAQMVDDCVNGHSDNAVIEAACGIGKSFAYLFPAMLSGKQVVIATSNIALQEQIAFKDAPMVRQMLEQSGNLARGYEIGFLKGKNNYICKAKARQMQEELELHTDNEGSDQMQEIEERMKEESFTGDISKLGFIPTPFIKWRFLGDTDACLGSKCMFYHECYYHQAKRKAVASNMIVVNYHMLFAHLLVTSTTEYRVLPKYDILICDEGHEIPDVARNFWSINVSGYAVSAIASIIEKAGEYEKAKTLKDASKDFFEELQKYYEGGKYKDILREPDCVDDAPLFWALDDAADVLTEIKLTVAANTLMSEATKQDILQNCDMAILRATKLKAHLRQIVKLSDDNFVYWIEKTKKSVMLKAIPVDASAYFKDVLFDPEVRVIVTSATLATGRDFSWIKKEIGMGASQELVEESPFDFANKAMIVCPRLDIDPNDPNFVATISPIILNVIQQVGGRTLVLFTSYAQMNGVHEKIVNEWDDVLKQGDRPRTVLADEFRERHESVLLATSSFWTGIDVQGESLSCLVINKLPFPAMNDPLSIWVKENVKNSFYGYMLPKAVLAFKQGFGRLIRHRDDFGVCVCFDTRLLEKPYGKMFLRSLPKMPGTRDYTTIKDFFVKNGVDFKPTPVKKEEPKQKEFSDLDDDDPYNEDY